MPNYKTVRKSQSSTPIAGCKSTASLAETSALLAAKRSHTSNDKLIGSSRPAAMVSISHWRSIFIITRQLILLSNRYGQLFLSILVVLVSILLLSRHKNKVNRNLISEQNLNMMTYKKLMLISQVFIYYNFYYSYNGSRKLKDMKTSGGTRRILQKVVYYHHIALAAIGLFYVDSIIDLFMEDNIICLNILLKTE
eukprot:281172_1